MGGEVAVFIVGAYETLGICEHSGQIAFMIFFFNLNFQTEALKCVAQASKNRSLADFEKVSVVLN